MAPGGAITPRLAGALAVSIALHSLLVAGFDSPFGARWGAISRFQPGTPIRAVLRSISEELPAERSPVATTRPADSSSRSSATGPRSLLPEPHYSLTRELDAPPGIMTRVEPEYPEAAARRMLSGKVRIRLLIEESGAVERVEILEAQPPGYFESSVERAFGAARFSPGMKDGRAVKVQLLLEIAFDGPPSPTSIAPAAPAAARQ